MGRRLRLTIAAGGRMGIFVSLAVGVLAGCGQRGPLTLPGRDVETPPVVESAPIVDAAPVAGTATEPVSETQTETGERESDDDEG